MTENGHSNIYPPLNMFTLTDTFNNVPLSRHHTLIAAVRARRRHARAIRRRNGPGSYVTYEITGQDGKRVDYNDLVDAEMTVDSER